MNQDQKDELIHALMESVLLPVVKRLFIIFEQEVSDAIDKRLDETKVEVSSDG